MPHENLSPKRAADDALKAAIAHYVKVRRHPILDRFDLDRAVSEAVYAAVIPSDHAVAEFLAAGAATVAADAGALLNCFEVHRDYLRFEQSYTEEDRAVGADMLAGYAFAEIVGAKGPFVSTNLRAGIGIWGPGVDYPLHRHVAEEAYAVLAGGAEFRVDSPAVAGASVSSTASVATTVDDGYCHRMVGDIIHVESGVSHGFRTADEPLVILYLWQNGDMREKSCFV